MSKPDNRVWVKVVLRCPYWKLFVLDIAKWIGVEIAYYSGGTGDPQ